MNQPPKTLLEHAQDAISALVDQADKTALEILDELQTAQEHLDKAIDTIQDILCTEE